jgi:hypothetical protein
MPYDVYYPDGCDSVVPFHTCDPCAEVETGRIRAVAYVKSSYYATLAANPTSSAVWTTGIESGDITVIPATNGSFDGGTAKDGPGYGDSPTKYMGSEFIVTYRDPNYIDNCDFYNAIKRADDQFHFVYKSETQAHLTEKTVSITPRAPIGENLDDHVVWEVAVKFNQFDSPCPFTAPAVLTECVALEPE